MEVLDFCEGTRDDKLMAWIQKHVASETVDSQKEFLVGDEHDPSLPVVPLDADVAQHPTQSVGSDEGLVPQTPRGEESEDLVVLDAEGDEFAPEPGGDGGEVEHATVHQPSSHQR